MDTEFWLSRWQRGETGWHLQEFNRHLSDYWPLLDIPAGTRVLVPLCGKSLDLLWLAARGYQVLGVELSTLAVEEFFTDHGFHPRRSAAGAMQRYQVDAIEILCGDFFDLTPFLIGKVGAVYDRASLIALPADQRRRYAAQLESLIPTQAPRLLITIDYDQGRMEGPPFSVDPLEVQRLFGNTHRVTELAAIDILPDSPRMRERGLTDLMERVYRLDPA